MFELSKSEYKSSLPEELAGRYRSADGPALKVALWLLCSGRGEAGEIADSLAMPLETVERALALWQAAGLVKERGAGAAGAENSGVKPNEKSRAATSAPKVIKALTDARAAELTLRDGNVAALFQETQELIGRPLDSGESRALLELYECEELPVEVILTVVAFCEPRLKNKRSLVSRVRREAEYWALEGVRDAESAAKHVRLLEAREKREKLVAEALGYTDDAPFSKPQRAMIARWYEEYGYGAEFAREAFERTGNDSIAYINAILKSWRKKGYDTIKDTYAEGLNTRAAASPEREESGAESLFEAAINEINSKG